MLNRFLRGLFAKAHAHNRRNILGRVRGIAPGCLLDLGCDDGAWTLEVARAAQARTVHGVEIVEERAKLASKNSVTVTFADLSKTLPLPDSHYDLIHANQVIEHVADVDLFASEIMRLLKPGGIAVVSTENASSWHNVFASVMGWQMFSLTNMSGLKLGIGNPLALHRDQPVTSRTLSHKVIFAYRGLIEFFAAHGFTIVGIDGAGYYPLPSIFARLDPRHAHFLTLVISKR